LGDNLNELVERFQGALDILKRRMFQDFSPHLKLGLTNPQLYMLYVIREKGPIKVTDLADQLEVKPSAITVMIDRLRNQGYVARQDDDRDRRVVIIVLTEEGQSILAKLKQTRNKILLRYLQQLDPLEMDQMICTLEKMTKEK